MSTSFAVVSAVSDDGGYPGARRAGIIAFPLIATAARASARAAVLFHPPRHLNKIVSLSQRCASCLAPVKAQVGAALCRDVLPRDA